MVVTMFQSIIEELHNELDDNLQPALKKCWELKNKVADREIRNKLDIKYLELSHTIDRVSLCISILNFDVSLEASPDYMVVKFT